MSKANPNTLKAAIPVSQSGYKYSGDDFSSNKPTSSQEADALLKAQQRIFQQAEGSARRQGVNVVVPEGENSGTIGPSARGVGHDGADGITGNMAITPNSAVRAVTVRKVDQVNLITGQDFRAGSKDAANDSLNESADNGGPREQMRGQQTQKNWKEDGKSFRSFPGNVVDEND